MKKIILNTLAALALILSVSMPLQGSASEQNSTPKVVIGTYISTVDGLIRIKGEDGNVYVLEVKNINDTITISQGYGDTKIEKNINVSELKVGTTVVINLQGVVLVDVKNN